MRQALTLHPGSRCRAATRIDAEAVRPRPDSLVLHYAVTGNIADLRMPAATAPARTEGLWQTTCFEAFLRASPGSIYYEFNFSPSTEWAAYRFSGYRAGMSIAGEVAPPQVEMRSDSAGCEMRASLELDGLPDLPGNSVWRLGLAAVLEETDGRKSYWALAHPPGRPDFHHSDCFALVLPAA